MPDSDWKTAREAERQAFDLTPAENPEIWRALRDVELALRVRDAATAAIHVSAAIQAAKEADLWHPPPPKHDPLAGLRAAGRTDTDKPREFTNLTVALLAAQAAVDRLIPGGGAGTLTEETKR